MYRIGEFSQLGQVSVRTLRHYDDLGLLKPAHIDRFTDYRYYTLEQLPRLNRILALKDLGLALDQIKRLLDDNLSAEQLRGMLTMKQAELEREVVETHSRLARVEARLRQIEREGKLSIYEVVLKELPSMHVASMRKLVPTLDLMVPIRCKLYSDLYERLAHHGIEAGDLEMALYHNEEYTEENIDMEAAVVVVNRSTKEAYKGMTIYEMPREPLTASVIHSGRFHDVCDAIIALYSWAGENGYHAGGAYREIHLFGRENDLHDYNAVTIEVQVPLIEGR